MAGIAVQNFATAIPIRDARQLPDTAAVKAVNMKTGTGALESIREPRFIATLGAGTKAAYRIPTGDINDLAQSFWMQFQDRDTDVVRTPVVNDAYQRYYWASPSTGFKYATKAAILANNVNAGLNVGVQRPTTFVTLDAIAGTGSLNPDGTQAGPKVTRSYIVTFVTEFGEEGAPSPAAEYTAAADQDWRLRDIPQPVTTVVSSAISTIRIYRTVTAITGETVFNRVVDLPVGTNTYIDRLSDLVVSGQPQIESENADAPPAAMQGIALMPNGIIVGFRDNNLYFSENFKPHSWPAAYTLTVQHPIVGLAVFGTTCIVLTQGNPATVTGNSGAVMSLSTADTPMPCLSRQSIAVAPEGVYWATSNGLALWAPGSTQIVTDSLIGRELWANTYAPSTIDAVIAHGAYTAIRQNGLVETAFGFPGDGVVEYSGFNTDGSRSYLGLDVWSNRPFYINGNSLFEFLPPATTPALRVWRSKEFQLDKPLNMGVVQARFEADPSYPTETLRVYCNTFGVYSVTLYPNKITKLPGGFKADVWQLEIEGRNKIHSIVIAQTVDELKKV